MNKKGKESNSTLIYAAALHNILNAMEKHRIFDRFGFNLPKVLTAKTAKITKLNHYQVWEFNAMQCDWINSVNREMLTGYMPPLELISILNQNIDTILE